MLQCHNRKLTFPVILKGLCAQRMFRLSTYKEPEHNISDKLPQYIYTVYIYIYIENKILIIKFAEKKKGHLYWLLIKNLIVLVIRYHGQRWTKKCIRKPSKLSRHTTKRKEGTNYWKPKQSLVNLGNSRDFAICVCIKIDSTVLKFLPLSFTFHAIYSCSYMLMGILKETETF